MNSFKLDWLILPLLGTAIVIGGWHAVAGEKVVTKDAAGDIALLEIDNKEDPRFAGFAGLLAGTMGLLTPEDVAAIAVSIPERTTALVLLFEHRWAARVKQAIIGAGGFLISRTTVSPEALELVNAELELAELSA